MGTWGVGLFSDDTASDIRDEYRDLVGDGVEGPAATDSLLQTWGPSLSDPDVAPAFWLALADTQWKLGRLEDRVRLAALKVIQEGVDLARWDGDPKMRAKRTLVLDKFRDQLERPQPGRKRVAKRFRNTCDWTAGEVLAYRLGSGRLALLRTLEHHVDRGGVSPVCDVLDHEGSSLPNARTVARLAPRPFFGHWAEGRDGTILIGATSAREIPTERIVRTGCSSPSVRSPRGSLVVLWRNIDESLRDLFGLE